MTTAATLDTIDLAASDVSGQRRVKVRGVTVKATVGDLVRSLVKKLNLIGEDAHGRPLTYRARLEREGRSLSGGEVIGDALEPNDHISLYPYIQAGATS